MPQQNTRFTERYSRHSCCNSGSLVKAAAIWFENSSPTSVNTSEVPSIRNSPVVAARQASSGFSAPASGRAGYSDPRQCPRRWRSSKTGWHIQERRRSGLSPIVVPQKCYHKASMGFKWQTLTKVLHGKPPCFVDSYKVAPIYISLQITTLQRPILIIKSAKNKCKGDSTQKEPWHLLVKITMRPQFRTLSSRLPASSGDSPNATANSSRRTRSTIW